jgi:hypothetical protein
MGSIRRPSFLKRQKEQKRLEKAAKKREERQARREAPKDAPPEASEHTPPDENPEPAGPAPIDLPHDRP